MWTKRPAEAFVAELDRGVVGTYFIRPNFGGPGGHVCNCGYAVAVEARGRGVASALCRHSQNEARAMDFRAMQFNMVASTNSGALRLWKRLGFEVVGTLPEAFRHPQLGFVDAYVMFKALAAGSA